MSEPDDSCAVSAAAPTRRSAFAIARIVLAALVLVFVAAALAKNWSQVSAHLTEVSPTAWVLASLAGLRRAVVVDPAVAFGGP